MLSRYETRTCDRNLADEIVKLSTEHKKYYLWPKKGDFFIFRNYLRSVLLYIIVNSTGKIANRMFLDINHFLKSVQKIGRIRISTCAKLKIIGSLFK